MENNRIRVGLTERHGMAVELLGENSPVEVDYSFLNPLSISNKFIRSPIKGFFRHYETANHDLVEAVLSPIFTKNRWVYSLANFHEAMAFNVLGVPVPRVIRFAFIRDLMMKDNFKKLIFWSEAGKRTMFHYAGPDDDLLKKTTVVYPAIRTVSDDLIKYNSNDCVHMLFTGDFFRKGGVNVIDAFEMVQKRFNKIRLILCCDDKIDFNTQNIAMKNKYLCKIKTNVGIISKGRISRERILSEVLPLTDIYLLPTYTEAFGFSILEAMAYGIPVISTNFFAIPEIIDNGFSGFLIDTGKFDCDSMFKGYIVNNIPDDFRSHVTNELYEYMLKLINSMDLRIAMGRNALETARSKFSFRKRNFKMFSLYKEAIS